MSNYQEILAQAKQLILDVGGFIQAEARNFDYNLVEQKGLNDLVSYVDKTAEQRLVTGLSNIIPGCGFIAEEGTAGHQDEAFIWIVDPLDGTTNFTHGLPVFAISVALMHNDSLVLGMVYEVNKE
jgi:myo-inositol-1(or 4)-monophosphatase